ncbi:hypothetical protein [Salinisphaera orenii]|uniref:hypothetical protein n=1 Tax=Salinisphaera orenii TaxID=856731 RepID=UPI000DBE4184
MGGWRAALELINRLAAWLGRWLAARRAARRQADRDQLEADPVDWYRTHFDGLRDDQSPAGRADADHTDTDGPQKPE